MDEQPRRTDQEVAELGQTASASIIKARRGRRVRALVSLIILIPVLLGSYFFVRSQNSTQLSGDAERASQPAPQSVGAATAGQGDIQVIVNALGTVTPIGTVTVHTQINGQLQDVAFTEGQTVKKGDFLAQVDPRPYQLLQAQYEGQLARDQGALAQARVDLTRYQKLAEQQSIARQQYEDQVYIVQQDEGTVKLDQAQVDQQKLNVTYCHIVAPISGRIGLRLVDPGNYVQTTDTTGIAVITQLQPITVVFPIPEDSVPDILPQLSAGTSLEVYAYDRANVQLLATGRTTALDSQIDTTTGTVKLRAQFGNADNALFPNQFINVRLLVKTLHNVVTVPTAALQRGAPGAYVYVISSDDIVSVRPVNPGPADGSMTAVNSGLAAGERVIIDGADRLRDGARVTIPGGSPPAPAATPNSAPNAQSLSTDHSDTRAAAAGNSMNRKGRAQSSGNTALQGPLHDAAQANTRE